MTLALAWPRPAAATRARPAVRAHRVVVLAVWLGLAATAGALAAVLLGPAGDYDLRNYHLYDGFALLQGRVGVDLAAAQLQSFYAPGLDLLYAALLAALNRHPAALGAVLGLPQGLAGFLTWCLARRLLPPATPGRSSIAAAAALIGVTGAAGGSTFAGPMSEMLPACCLLGAILLLGTPLSRRARAAAGLLAGLAVGLKLTAAPFAVGLAVAAALTGGGGRRGAAAFGGFAGAAAAGAALAGGAWWGWLSARYGDPVFPYFNEVFHSAWAAPIADTDTRFLPRDVWQAVAYPLFWAARPCTLVSELPVRDPRIALGWVAALVVAGRALWRRRAAPAVVAVLAVWVVGYGLWEAAFSILRYLVPLELLTGPLLVAVSAPVLARARSALVVPAAWALAAGLIAVTVYPDWGHAPPGPEAVAVRPPAFPAGSLVVLLDPSPMAYVAAFAPVSVRFVGADNNLVRPGAPDLMARAVAAAIAAQAGPLWGLEAPAESPGAADVTLRAYGLARAPGCVRVRSNLDADAILACPLRRLGRTPAPRAVRTAPARPAASHAASGRR
ncbi:MAG: hypothetical protein HIU82_17830 [Proteobacteria bacterium]|nr:hypothetical protein [Pseudomonadota bacterium]